MKSLNSKWIECVQMEIKKTAQDSTQWTTVQHWPYITERCN